MEKLGQNLNTWEIGAKYDIYCVNDNKLQNKVVEVEIVIVRINTVIMYKNIQI